MSGYIGNIPVPQATQTRQSFTATSGQTTFATYGYYVGFTDVWLNGVKLDSSDYTATNGSDIVLASGATAGDILEYISYSTFQVAQVAQIPFTTAGGAADNISLNIYYQIPFTLTDGTPDNISLA